MVRHCRYCRSSKPVDEFVEPYLCQSCSDVGHGRRSVVVALEEGWAVPEPRLPEMRVPSDEEVAQGYQGEVWVATKSGWKLEVIWRGDHGKFLCHAHATDPGSTESRTFDYPHEVVEWIGVWSMQLSRPL